MLQIDKIYNIDCMEGMSAMRRQGIVANLLLTDIPYNEVNRDDNGLRNLDKKNADAQTFDLEEYLQLADMVVSGSFVIFCGIGQVSKIRQFFLEKNYTTRVIVWEKTNPSPMNGECVYLSGIELCVYAKKKGATFNAFCKNTVFRFPTEKQEYSTTQKPISLWNELIKDNSNEGDLVLDTCVGGGTTSVACHKLSRHYIAFELDKNSYEKAQERLRIATAQLSIFDLQQADN